MKDLCHYPGCHGAGSAHIAECPSAPRPETPQVAGCGDPKCTGKDCGSIVCGLPLRPGSVGVAVWPAPSNGDAVRILRGDQRGRWGIVVNTKRPGRTFVAVIEIGGFVAGPYADTDLEIGRRAKGPHRFNGLRFEHIGTEDHLVTCGFCGCRTSGFGLACCEKGIAAQKHLRGRARQGEPVRPTATTGQERATYETDEPTPYDASFGRLADIIDEEFGMQPVMKDAEMLTFLEQKLAESRRERDQTGASEPGPIGNNEMRTCWCYGCLNAPEHGLRNPVLQRMIVCPACGNKRCPRASDHRFACTGSNEPGQFGSRYGGDDIPTRLLALWHEANVEMGRAAGQSGFEETYQAWSGATKDLLLAVGYEWSEADQDYVPGHSSGDPKEGGNAQ